MRVAYLVNQYPHVSHTFIRREIAALEAAGTAVERFSIRPSAEELVDPADREERRRTEVLLDGGAIGLLLALAATAVRRPLPWLRTVGAALRLGRRSGRGVLRHLAYLAEACVLVRRLRGRGVRHLHAHFGTNSAAVAMLACLLGGPPYSFTVHGPEEFDAPESISLREKVARSAGAVVVSDFGRGQLLRWAAPEDWAKVRVVRCGLDGAFLSAGPRELPEAPRLVCVGRLAGQKGQLLLLEALALVAADGIDFEMTLAGDGPLRPALEESARRLGLGERVRITGWLGGEAVRRELLGARLMVLPSFAEGLPVVLMEALALGRPVVTTYVAGIPELVENGVNGWLVPAGSATALAAALAEALRAPTETLTRMGRAGAARVAALHDVSRETAKLAEMFQAVAADHEAALAAPLGGRNGRAPPQRKRLSFAGLLQEPPNEHSLGHSPLAGRGRRARPGYRPARGDLGRPIRRPAARPGRAGRPAALRRACARPRRRGGSRPDHPGAPAAAGAGRPCRGRRRQLRRPDGGRGPRRRATVVERHDPARRGKGFALDHGVRFLEQDPPDVVVIVDADCVVQEGALVRLVYEAAATGRPIQAAYLMAPPAGAGYREQVSAFAFRYKNLIRPLGLRRLGLPCLLTGTGMAFPWPLLRDAVLADGNIVEDMQLGLDLAAAGRPPRFCPEAGCAVSFPPKEKRPRPSGPAGNTGTCGPCCGRRRGSRRPPSCGVGPTCSGWCWS